MKLTLCVFLILFGSLAQSQTNTSKQKRLRALETRVEHIEQMLSRLTTEQDERHKMIRLSNECNKTCQKKYPFELYDTEETQNDKPEGFDKNRSRCFNDCNDLMPEDVITE